MAVNESTQHREEVEKYLADGYIDYGFIAFLKLSFFYEYIGNFDLLNQLWTQIKGLDKKEGYALFAKKLRDVEKGWEFNEEITYSELKALINEKLSENSVIPDAWMFDGSEVIVVEVFNSSPLDISRMEKYSWIDEYLCDVHSGRLRLSLYEVNLKFAKRMIKHDLNMFFDMVEFGDVPSDIMHKYHSHLETKHRAQTN